MNFVLSITIKTPQRKKSNFSTCTDNNISEKPLSRGSYTVTNITKSKSTLVKYNIFNIKYFNIYNIKELFHYFSKVVMLLKCIFLRTIRPLKVASSDNFSYKWVQVCFNLIPAKGNELDFFFPTKSCQKIGDSEERQMRHESLCLKPLALSFPASHHTDSDVRF